MIVPRTFKLIDIWRRTRGQEVLCNTASLKKSSWFTDNDTATNKRHHSAECLWIYLNCRKKLCRYLIYTFFAKIYLPTTLFSSCFNNTSENITILNCRSALKNWPEDDFFISSYEKLINNVGMIWFWSWHSLHQELCWLIRAKWMAIWQLWCVTVFIAAKIPLSIIHLNSVIHANKIIPLSFSLW